jgi:hypothetical protein
MAQKRQWTVPEHLPELGEEVIPVDRNEAREAFLELEAIGQRLGGSFQIAPIRTEVSPNRWITRGWAFRHVPYVPAEKLASEEQVDGELVEA